MTRVVDLPAVPGLGGLYARGAAGAARRAVLRRPRAATVPDVEYRVRGVRADLAHLTAYQRLVGESASDALPAGYVHVLAFPVATALLVRDDFPLPALGMVHLANTVEQHRPVGHDEPLDIQAVARDLRAHRTGTQVDLVVSVRSGGELVWRGVSTYLAKAVDLGLPAAPDDARAPFVAPLPTGQWRLDAATGRRYAAVSGDRNPIHLSAASAKVLGFPRAIAHGMDTAARLLADVGPARGDAFTWSVEFAKPVLLPSTVATSVRRRPGGGFTLAAWDPRTARPHVQATLTPSPDPPHPPNWYLSARSRDKGGPTTSPTRRTGT
ncbi:MaoC/PaaZ C-terminal domain-containing protein [Cellulomonas gilvus]|uniref:MaoC domain protein dehydratase n=1 Tax=Cellulomonas gilvus (strain ATCC 13127 / NRRL B-14078) TaxID=593907 RepID=F8A4I3_CELGA|nr:MaoC/PaaZ C-terminal domain-containing protein [Cellulomonas gilvus]AEI13231.1 MaoC domain protein dehydratase [Cellulomonas gilvus ATCC 13127]